MIRAISCFSLLFSCVTAFAMDEIDSSKNYEAQTAQKKIDYIR